MNSYVCKFCKNSFLLNYSSQKFCSLSCSNRHNLNNKNNPILPTNYSVELAEMIGILLGDGSVTKYFVKVYLNAISDINYSTFVKKLASKLFKKIMVKSSFRENNGTVEIQISSKDVCDYLRKIGFNPKERNIPHWILERTDFTKATIRGLFDTEGSVGIKFFNGKNGKYLYKQLTVTNKNANILKFIENYLLKFGYKPTLNSDKNIYISNKDDIKKYLLDIKPHNDKLIRKIKVKSINGFTYGGLRRMVRHQS